MVFYTEFKETVCNCTKFAINKSTLSFFKKKNKIKPFLTKQFSNTFKLWCEWDLTYTIGNFSQFWLQVFTTCLQQWSRVQLIRTPSTNNKKLDSADEFYNICSRERFRGNGNTIGVTVKFRKLARRLIFFKGPSWGAYFWRGLCSDHNWLGLHLEGNLRLKIDWLAYNWKEI